MKSFRTALLISFSFVAAAHADTAEIWKSKCKSCHGDTGKGDTKQGKKEKVEDMTVAAWHTKWTDEKIKTVILEGSTDNKKMKPFKDKLSAEEVDGLVKHIRTFKP